MRLSGRSEPHPDVRQSGRDCAARAATSSARSDFDGSHVILTVFPGADGHFELYEDDGVSEAYTQGEYETTAIRSTLRDDGTLAIQHRRGAGALRGLAASSARLNCTSGGFARRAACRSASADADDWSYDPAARDLLIRLDDADRRQPLSVVVRADDLRSVLALDATTPSAARRSSTWSITPRSRTPASSLAQS